jgi:hypothetical protein
MHQYPVAAWSTSAAFVDYDRNGLLDLAVVDYVQFYPPDFTWNRISRA